MDGDEWRVGSGEWPVVDSRLREIGKVGRRAAMWRILGYSLFVY